MRKVILIIMIALLSGCLGMSKQKSAPPLSEPQALRLAVSLANEKCLAQFKETPFDTASYTILFKEDRWSWGGLDLAGINGFSAQVMFDAWGENQNVEVFLSIDNVVPDAPGPDPDENN